MNNNKPSKGKIEVTETVMNFDINFHLTVRPLSANVLKTFIFIFAKSPVMLLRDVDIFELVSLIFLNMSVYFFFTFLFMFFFYFSF